MIPYIAVLAILIVAILYEVYGQSESFSNAGAAARDASGNVVQRDASGNVARTDASGNDLRVSLQDLYGLLGPFRMDASGNPIGAAKPSDASGNSVKAPAPADTPQSNISLDELTKRISKSVAKQVKDDLAAQHSLDDVFDKYAPCDLTDAEAQGQEYEKVKPRPSEKPDMSEYIRKDSIPCWNCSVP
jgi:hypothetical protein